MTSPETIQRHAQRLVASLAGDVAEELRLDPLTAIPKHFGIRLELRAERREDSGCQVDGSYTDKPELKITIADSLSSGRTFFSALHELGHHFCRRDDELQTWFWELDESGAREEELIADAFAAEMLLPEDIVRSYIPYDGPSAGDVLALMQGSTASREACCVRAAQRLRSAGCVVLSEGNVLRFTATRSTGFRVPRMALQDDNSIFKRAEQLGAATEEGVRIRFPSSGTYSQPMFGNAIQDGRYVVTVLMTDSPPWVSFTPLVTDDNPNEEELECPTCDEPFSSWAKPCPRCGDRQCWKCEACSCGTKSTSSRKCTNCTLDLPTAAPAAQELCDNCG